VQLTGVVSRKIHGSAGTFDINLPLSGDPGIECRKGGDFGSYTLVFTFANPLTFVEQAAFAFPDPGPGTEIGGHIDPSDAHNYVVNLLGLTRPLLINITLSNVVDSVGNFSGTISSSMGILVGDVNSTRRTDSGDVTAVRNHTVSIPDQQTCRFDVNADGRIDAGDVTVTRNASVTVLP
jgi:hypothetical protein